MSNKRGKRDKMIGVWCTPKEHSKIVEKAEESGVSKGRFCREYAVGNITEEGERLDKRYQLIQLFKELNRIGINLNQMAKVANQSGNINSERLEEMFNESKKIFRKIGRKI